jgi:hypothetical protein
MLRWAIKNTYDVTWDRHPQEKKIRDCMLYVYLKSEDTINKEEKVTLESDCLRVTQMVEANDLVSWALVHEARGLLRIYKDMAIKKVDRLSNGVAHVLAQLGNAGVSGVLRDSAPECVQDLIINDVNVT